MLTLPKKYLSYSAIDLWNKSKDQYRKRYYENEPFIDTPETLYGKKVHKMIEDNDPLVKRIPRYNLHEVRVEIMLEDVPLIGYIDTLCPFSVRFMDYKTGRPKPDGSPRWDPVSVAKTKQLPYYSLFLKELNGSVEDLCHLVWLPTTYIKKSVEMDGHLLIADSRDVEWNNEVHMFPRVIHEYERKAAREEIIRSAHEISDDYAQYKKEKLALGALPQAPEIVLG